MEFDEAVRRAEKSVESGDSISHDGYIFRGICYALLAVAIAIKEGKENEANQTPKGKE